MSSTMTKTTLFSAILAMASTTAAHMTMSNPVPYNKPNNSPLEPNGSNFPCKVAPGGGYVATSQNDWSVGSEVILTFDIGTATHGGGSCQVSVTKDKEPTGASVWKVVHSFEGACVTSDAGNNGAINSHPFTIPSELPDGELTMAWTWFNKVGNREMYMNCAPVTVTGGSGDGYDSLPDMAVANTAGFGTCATSEGFDYTFANPGKYVTRAGTGPYKELCGGAASEGGSTGGGSAPSAPAAPATPKVPEATVETPKAPAAAPVANTPTAPSGGASGGSSCSVEGALLCSGEDKFGICSNGQVAYQAVAAGTKCANGAIARRDYIHRSQRSII